MCHKRAMCFFNKHTKSSREREQAGNRLLNKSEHIAQSTGKMVLRQQALYFFVLVSLALAHCVSAYQYPINVAVDRQRSNLAQAASRRSEELGSGKRENEAQQLRQLHQVVDTMAQLLGEEEQQQQASEKNSDRQPSPVSQKGGPEMMDELEIKQALEELEKMQQQQEGLQAVESRFRPVVVTGPEHQQQQQQKQQQAALESLIDEIGEELGDDQFSQEADRLLQNGDSTRVGEKSEDLNKDADKAQDSARNQRAAPEAPSSTSAPAQRQPSENSTKSSLFVGQLDSINADLGPALANDFYAFHGESNGSQSDRSASQDTSSMQKDQPAAGERKQEDSRSSMVLGAGNDLDAAAQTRNSMIRPNIQPSFGQGASTIRFDFSQPAIQSNAQLPRPSALQANPSQDQFLAGFRRQNGPELEDNQNQFPTSTLIPIVGASDNFWRPASNLQTDGRDINQQYDRARGSAQTFPPLPESRFQSLGPAGQSVAAPTSRQTQHVHFTGHSFIPSGVQTQFSASQQANQQLSARDRPFTSTIAPLISVLSGSDSSVGNSVNWNPPATLNPPPARQPPLPAFNNQFPSPTSTQPSAETFFSPHNRGPASPHFQGNTFQQPRNIEPVLVDPRPEGFKPARPESAFVASTEFSNFPETTTNEDRFTVATTQDSALPPQAERDTSDSEVRSSVRALANNQKFFSPNDLNNHSPTTTQSSLANRYSEPTRNPNRPSAPTTTVASSPITTQSNNAPSNATAKKDDTVIYYYYYYDDNKNATVVAKNMTTSNKATSLDEAIEADGGIEDTPYMDDPAPISGTRTKPPSTTTPTSTTTTTTASSASTTTTTPSVPSSTFGAPIHHPDGRSRSASHPNLSRDSSPGSVQKSFANEKILDTKPVSRLNVNQFDIDQPRTPASTINRLTSLHHPKSDSSVTTFTPTPYYVPSTSSTRPGAARAQASNNHDSSTNLHLPSTTESSSQPAFKAEVPVNKQSFSAKLQNDLIQNVLNGNPASSHHRHPTTPSAPIASGTSHGGRGPLSNASRYGTNNNLVLDPFGLDPSAPATIAQHHQATTSNTSVSHKNWQSNTATHQFNRKPSSVSVTSENSLFAEVQSSRNQFGPSTTSTSTSRSTNQHFSPQRNVQTAAQGSRAPHVSTQSSQRVASTTSTVLPPANKQLFPESDGSLLIGNDESSTRSSAQSPRPSSLQDHAQAKVVQPTKATGSNDLSDSEILESDERIAHEPPKRLSTNGRPTTTNEKISEITRTSSAQPSKVQQNERAFVSTSNPISSTQSSLSTSPSRPSAPQQISAATSSSFSSTMSSSTPSSVPTSTVAVSSQPTTAAETSTPTVSTQTSTSTASVSQESSSPASEDTTSGASSSRRKFGNRNSRFQTRLNSISSTRSSTTTSTTPSPVSSSTTRRPTTSTTRKSSKQLFAGRRRLNSIQVSESSSSPAQGSSNSPTNVTAAAVETPVTSTPAAPSQASSPSRARFGNSFTARSRLSTPATAIAGDTSGSTQRPSLFGSQRTSKPRLPFIRPGKPTSTTAAATDSTPSSAETSSAAETVSSVASSDKTSTEKSIGDVADPSLADNVSSGSLEDESGEKSESATNGLSGNEPAPASNPPTPPAPTTTTSSTPAPDNGRNKPKVRPLFASRQRNTSLFGNRRSPTA